MNKKLLPQHVIKFASKAVRANAYLLHWLSRRLDRMSMLTRAERAILKRNVQFKDKHKGQRAFVIVNGPSLAEQDVTLLKNDLTFVVSGFYKHEVIKTWQPSYYSIIDANFFNGSENSTRFFKSLNEVIHDSTFFIPLYRGYEANLKYKLLPPEKTFYTATAGLPSDAIDMTGVIQSFMSVSAFALAHAIYMGCNPIYLLGFDHDYLVNRGADRHFYKGGTIAGAPAVTQSLSERHDYDAYMASCLALWKNYRSLDRIAKKRGIRIYNATNGGYLDVFERINYEDVINGNSNK